MKMMGVEKLGYRPGLDGLRGLAAAAVVIAHYLLLDFGGHAVDVFFVLSGFLITTILLEELAETRRVRLARFYERRARRLLPCLLAVVTACFVLLPLLQPATRDGILPVLLYVGNWARAGGADLGSLDHTWSLAIEEQFYLLWPPFVIAAARVSPTRMAKAIVAVAVIVAVVREVGGFSDARIYNGTDLRSDVLLFGAATAYAWAAGWRPRLSVWAPVVVLVVVFAGWPAGPSHLTVTAVAASGLLLCVLDGQVRWLTLAPLVWLGRRSYGLYLWHFPIGHILNERTPATLALAVTATLIVTECSYRWIEAPFRRHPILMHQNDVPLTDARTSLAEVSS